MAHLKNRWLHNTNLYLVKRAESRFEDASLFRFALCLVLSVGGLGILLCIPDGSWMLLASLTLSNFVGVAAGVVLFRKRNAERGSAVSMHTYPKPKPPKPKPPKITRLRRAA